RGADARADPRLLPDGAAWSLRSRRRAGARAAAPGQRNAAGAGLIAWAKQRPRANREAYVIENRSSPPATAIPVLCYEDVVKASEWLCAAFGFKERLRIGSHRVQLVYGDGAVIVTE